MIKATLLIFFYLISINAAALQKPKIVASSADFPPFTTADHKGFEDYLVPEMYRRAGFQLEVHRLPGQRGLKMVEDGNMDSTFMRVKGIIKNFKNLVQMDEPVFKRDFVAFSRNKNINIENWDSLEPYNVAYVNGWKILEWNIKKYKSIQAVKTSKQLFQLLDKNRVDVIVYAKYAGLYTLNQMGIKGVHIVGKPFATKEMAVILNKKHKDILPKLNATLKAMKDDGTYQQYFDKTLGQLIQ